MRISLGWQRVLSVTIAFVTAFLVLGNSAAEAAGAVEPYVLRYLEVREPVPLAIDAQGNSRSFSAAELSIGKRLFEDSCKNCHVGGATLPDPTVSLSLEALQGATPSRDNISSLVAYLRQPMSYDGTEESYGCREINEKWMDQTAIENLSAFVLRAAQKAPGWGITSF
jgi:photosystem II cytochrome c550